MNKLLSGCFSLEIKLILFLYFIIKWTYSYILFYMHFDIKFKYLYYKYYTSVQYTYYIKVSIVFID